MKTERFDAIWCQPLIWVTLGTSALFLAISFFYRHDLESGQLSSPDFWIALAAPALIAGAALFLVRGYGISSGCIIVRRLLWSTRIPRTGLQSARHDPGALKGAIRTCGNGGFFSITGWFHSSALGKFRAWITHPADAVVLRFADRTLVISPSDPEEFIQTLALQSSPQKGISPAAAPSSE